MNVKVKFFALGRELIGQGELQLQLPENNSVAGLIEKLKEEYPRFAQLNSYLVAVNMEYAGVDTELKDGDEVAIIPPVSGG
ncbi:MAG: molybdopterin converting factor subunit 1 [Candidatus Brocadia sp. WS118]|nr:MAG: molybdopterin converting factor subunit 1 [Candidatus Brocadia sp. WS118]